MEDVQNINRQFKTKTELAKFLDIGSRQTLYNRAERNNIDLDKLSFTKKELSILSGRETSSQQIQEDRRMIQNRRDRDALIALKHELSIKDDIIAGLKSDKADLSQKLDKSLQLQDQQQQLTLSNTKKIERLESELDQYKNITTDDDAEITVQTEKTNETTKSVDITTNDNKDNHADRQLDTNKKHWWQRLF